jgi:hypothetical protein
MLYFRLMRSFRVVGGRLTAASVMWGGFTAAARLFGVTVAAFGVTVAGQRGLNKHAGMLFLVRTVRPDGPECRTLWLGWLL